MGYRIVVVTLSVTVENENVKEFGNDMAAVYDFVEECDFEPIANSDDFKITGVSIVDVD